MKFKITRSVLTVIIISQLIGLFGILYQKRMIDITVSTYRNLLKNQLTEKTDANTIKQLLYEYEANVYNYIWEKDLENKLAVKETTTKVEINLRNQIIAHGKTMSNKKFDEQAYKLYDSVKDDVLTYLNYNAVIMALGNLDGTEIEPYIKENIKPLIARVNESIKQLNELSEQQTNQAYTIMLTSINKCQIVSIVCAILIITVIILSLLYNYKILSSLETTNDNLQAKALQNEQRISQIQKLTIIGIADLIESRSGETGQHVKRTSKYVNMIVNKAQKTNTWAGMINDEYVDLVTRAAPLHDIGKIIISDTILNKPGRLTPEEYETMKTHATAGGRIIEELLNGIEDPSYLKVAKDIALYHHEKWDGTGYPTGKKGKDIPLSARIMAVADVFDALVSERCYKVSMSYESAFDFIREEAGSHFDPIVVDLFLQLKDEIINNANTI